MATAKPAHGDGVTAGFRVIPALPDGPLINDPDDAFLLAMAKVGDADYLVTGDRRAGLLQLGTVGRTRIVTPANFCREML